MIIKLNVCNNFSNTLVYILNNSKGILQLETSKINNLIVQHYEHKVYSIIDLNSNENIRFQLIDKLPDIIIKQLENYDLSSSIFYDFGILISKVQNENKKNLYEIKVQSKNKIYQLVTNREDVEINNTYWIGLPGALLYDGSILQEGTIAGLFSEAMLLGEKSIYNIDSKTLLTNENDLDKLKDGIY
ncbi:hypothetical protein QLQ80_00150 [Mycoplasma sp. M5725]|uniref:tRNA-binding domain-containing protein n=1 Tax=Mycoplasma phocimorsus TaxID=3045839 RepID=A0AAJ1PRS0_9MOLU|nr:hypothetical protein [Mycoplasma phocimorsus]MDJ1645503.1 hypothetical protein [Mycoplasma phocimorsus]MDJ1646449.1 hypothetical protein [Mycoplasma phocimorsus]MDJ1647945.1 hypothetical protein [Mycoplasma phocimorsus]MDJ1648859.1 hypothetical protein [Mycoplasma phocimorsus]